MACNCPVVATDVGNAVSEAANTPGGYLTGFGAADIAEKLTSAMSFAEKHNRTECRSHLLQPGLVAFTIATHIINVNKTALSQSY